MHQLSFKQTLAIVGSALLLSISTTSLAKKLNDNMPERPHRPDFKKLDSNHDGVIDLTEFSNHKIPHGDHKTIFAHIDTDHDGNISREEFMEHKPPHKPQGKKPNQE